MAGWRPEERVRVPAARQGWYEMTFLHHGYRPEDVAPLLTPDVHEGLAWIGITPFWMHASLAPVLPGPRTWVPEVNLRTYVRDRRGRDAIWFFSLELDHAAVSASLRSLLRLPYRWSSIGIDTTEALRTTTVRRRPPHRDGALHLAVEVGRPLAASEVSELEAFLVGRWRAATRIGRAELRVPVEHPPWPLWSAELIAFEDQLSPSLGLPEPVTAPWVHYSPGVEVRLGAPRPPC